MSLSNPKDGISGARGDSPYYQANSHISIATRDDKNSRHAAPPDVRHAVCANNSLDLCQCINDDKRLLLVTVLINSVIAVVVAGVVVLVGVDVNVDAVVVVVLVSLEKAQSSSFQNPRSDPTEHSWLFSHVRPGV
ncbi:hypothetical protein KIN20_022511 [Parelaphostrongylus tenuis]|uniref:Transmembrane protein n=1 Tax=Parelaphostrongylus tenuis TaxID=148309 RepID=A0AAD5MQF0_PARTN|nr:hypothetical protein KIN20_022511 [Parelaphostrongylus tenuis]